MSTPFALWVANTVYAISGIWPQHLCGMPSKEALTSTESRAAGCQALSGTNAPIGEQEPARAAVIAPTDLAPDRVIH